MMTIREFADELRKYWSFDDGQQHTHSWHSREDFIAKKLPDLLASGRQTMETAPKDGSWFLAYSRSGDWRRVSWGINRHGERCWCTVDWYFYETEKPFTHWMPLPASPTS